MPFVPLEEFMEEYKQNSKDYALQFFQDAGYSPAVSQGIVANLIHESNLNPAASGDKGASYGIAQWQKERLQGLKTYSQRNQMDYRTLDAQLQYINHELMGGSGDEGAMKARHFLQRVDDPREATRIFSQYYERPSKPMLKQRMGILDQLSSWIGPAQAEAAEIPLEKFQADQSQSGLVPLETFMQGKPSESTTPPESRSTGQRLAGVVADYLGLKLPVVGMTPAQIGALALGGTVGAGAGPAGVVAGAGLAYGAEEQAMKGLRQYAGTEPTQTLPESAIGAARDVATGATYEAAGQIGGVLMKPVAEKVGQFLTNRAKGMYERVLKAPPTVPAELRDRAVQTALEGDYAVTKKGLEKLQTDMSTYNQRVSQIIDEAAAGGKEIDVRKVVQKLESLKTDYSKMPFPKKFITAIENAQNEIIAEHGSRIPVDQAQDMKQMIYKVYNKYYQSKAPIDPIDVEINQAVAQDIMKQLEAAIPEVANLNKQWSNRINLAGLLERAVNRTRNYEVFRLSDMIMATGGAAAERGFEGGIHASIINRVINNPTVWSKLALMLGKSRPWTKEALNRAMSYGLVTQAREDIEAARPPEKVEPESKRGFTILNQ